MSTKDHDKLMESNPEYRGLFMKYLGCLRSMADASVYLAKREEMESFETAFDDAEETYPHLRIKRVLDGRELIILR